MGVGSSGANSSSCFYYDARVRVEQAITPRALEPLSWKQVICPLWKCMLDTDERPLTSTSASRAGKLTVEGVLLPFLSLQDVLMAFQSFQGHFWI